MSGVETLFDEKYALPSHENEFFELYYLESFPIQITNLFINNFLLSHSGIAIRSTQSEKLIVLEYRPINQSICFLPLVSNLLEHQSQQLQSQSESQSQSQLVWNQKAMITMTKTIDESYWMKSVYLARINGVVYRHYLDWVTDYILLHPTFLPYSICLNSQNCPYPKQNWDTFVTDTFSKLSEFAVVINPINTLYESNWIYISQFIPERILLSNEPSVVQYYSQLLTCLTGRFLYISLPFFLSFSLSHTIL